MAVIRTLALVFLLVLAGCAAPATQPTETPTETNATVTVDNAANRTYTVELRLVPERLTRVTVVGSDGVSRPVENLSAVSGVYAFAPRNATDVRISTVAESTSEVRLAPGSGTTTRLVTTGPDATLVVVVRVPGRVVRWATIYCGPTDTIGSVDLTLGDGGSFQAVGLQCQPR
jgi:hypothetical protein